MERRTKNVLCLLLITCLAFSLAGCKAEVDPQTTQAVRDALHAMQEEESGAGSEASLAASYEQAGLTKIEEDDPLWEDAAFELPAIAQLLAYKATFSGTFDEKEPADDDFWTVTGMAVTAVPPENATDVNQINHVTRDVVLDYAAALLPGFGAESEAPALQDVYGVSSNPRSEIIDIDGLSIGVTSSIVLLGKDTKSGEIVLRVHIEDESGLIKATDWDVLVEPWDDGQEHALPLVVKTFYPVN